MVDDNVLIKCLGTMVDDKWLMFDDKWLMFDDKWLLT